MSGISAYSPISTLERQYASPVGQRLFLFVKLNANCCLPGGVEALLKHQHQQPLGVAVETASPSANSSFNENDFDAATEDTLCQTTASTADDPFAFLNQPTSDLPPPVATPEKKSSKVGKFFTKLAKQTHQNLEKGITNLAIRADQGKNPDKLSVALYDSSGSAVVSLTEMQTLPVTDFQRMKGVVFAVPLTVPPQWERGSTMILKLWIQSGAALIKTKHHLLGQCIVAIDSLQHPSEVMVAKSLPLQSQVVVDGQLQLLVCKDFKFPPMYGRGWSLTDPDLSGYTQESLFHWPLDQSYGFTKGSVDWWIATERATESTMVLPAATAVAKMAASACRVSLMHATSVAASLLANRHDSNSTQGATVQLQLSHLLVQDATHAAQVSLHWQRPDSIFEVEVLPATKLNVHTVQVPLSNALQIVFYPKVCKDDILPAILQQHVTRPSYLVGNLKIIVYLSAAKTATTGTDPFAPTGTGSLAVAAEEETWQGIMPLESYLNRPTAELSVPVHNHAGIAMANVVLSITATLPAQLQPYPQVSSCAGGLVSVMGLDVPDMGTLPTLEFDPSPVPPTDAQVQRRHQQLKTMGNFVSYQYLQNHISATRSQDAALLMDRVEKYQTALSYNPQSEILPSHKDRNPKPFRPSSSRTTAGLAGIPFNVHAVTMTVEQGPNPSSTVGGCFANTTCGAPADHARGFGPLFQGGPSGGLRRLESRRAEWIQKLNDAQSALIQAVASYFVAARHKNQTVFHISSRNHGIANLRWRVFELNQQLHQITWACAVRRVNVFSQALGIALTSYLTSISQHPKAAELWHKHGYLVAYEGLLSAAGKELGMIEDASVGIAMLRNVTVVVVSDEKSAPADKVDVVNSPHLRWIHIATNQGVGSSTQYSIQIGIDAEYHATRLPSALQNGATVRFYPVLYQVGVDIRQVAAHTSMNVKAQLSTGTSSNLKNEIDTPPTSGNLLDEEDDDEGGVTDTDVLVQLNYEAMRKMNVYAHSVSPIQPAPPNNQQLPVHPMLTSLHEHILGSSGKMNHSILDEAATVSQQLGGGGVVFCKSGKDRTAMHVTYKQSQYIHRFADTGATQQQVYEDATTIRVYGTRLPICEKNVGQAKYAFNTLQVRFMPDMLKPPTHTLAGFLKGGAVFKGGGIES